MITDILTDPRYKDCRPKTRDNTNTSIVVYLINPFSAGTATCGGKETSTTETEEVASFLALIMCYQELLDALPEKLRQQTYLEMVPLHAVLAANSAAPDQQVISPFFLNISLYFLVFYHQLINIQISFVVEAYIWMQ